MSTRWIRPGSSCAGTQTPISQLHIRVLLAEMDLGRVNLDLLAVQLTAAMDGPLLLYLSAATDKAARVQNDLTQAWTDLVERVCR